MGSLSNTVHTMTVYGTLTQRHVLSLIEGGTNQRKKIVIVVLNLMFKIITHSIMSSSYS